MQENKYEGEPHRLMYRNFLTNVILVLTNISKIKNQGISFRGEIDHLSMPLLLVSKTTLYDKFELPESEYACKILNNAIFI